MFLNEIHMSLYRKTSFCRKTRQWFVFLWKYRLLDFLIFKHRKKSLCRGVNWKNFLQWKSFIRKNHLWIHCKDSFCRRIRKWFPSAKRLTLKLLVIYRIKSFWKSENFLLWKKPFKMKTTCHYIRKNPSVERQENDFFLLKY